MEKTTLQAELRGIGRHALREVRDHERVPAVVYGSHQAPLAISVNAKALQKALHAAGTGLLPLQIGTDAPVQVLAREVQRHPTRHNTLHVDFQAVSMTEKLRLEVPVIHAGSAPAMINQDIVLVRNTDAVLIECLPADIPAHLVADISKLVTTDDEVLVKDLAVPAGVKILTDGDHVVFSLTIARVAVEEEAEAAVASAEDVEVVAKGKAKEGAEEEPTGKEKK